MPVSYKQRPASSGYDTIVIGSGMGGLATAALLSKYGGRRVCVLERHYVAGGYTHAFKRPGYEWDVGIHYIGQAGVGEDMHLLYDEVTGGHVRWARMPEAYDRIIMGGKTYDLVAGRFAEQMKSYFPGERVAIDDYVRLVRKTVTSARAYFAEKALPPGPLRLLGLALRAPFLRYARRTVAEVLSSLTSNRELMGVLAAQYGDYGMIPSRASFAIHAAVAAHYFDGAYYPIGGASVLAEGAERVIQAGGGAVYVGAEVAAILVEGERAVGVRMADGRELRSREVVSDAGLRITYERLVPRRLAVEHGLDTLIHRVPASTGHLCLHLGFRSTAEELGLTGTNLWVFPDSNHDKNVRAFEDNPKAALPLVFISFPSAKDPSFQDRYPGRATVEVVTCVPYSWFREWEDGRWRKRGESYETEKERLSERLLDALYAQLPALRGKVDYQELSTPLSTRHFAGHPSGEIYGMDHSPERFRLPVHAETPVAGLYVTGADLTVAGVSGALLGGLVTTAAILKGKAVREIVRAVRSLP